MKVIRKGRYTTYKDIEVRKGSLGDYGHEYWTEADWKRHNDNVKKWTEDGTLGEISKIDLTLIHNPLFDDPKSIKTGLSSYKIVFITND